ncbi:SDR family NAD(P)-dependent oxidoreductase [Glaciihabitans arcticus]|uniref:SDR family NAD(P)-dependent oxidoreductase n=1 Tax=Glaciihabitans arcticus TaxID=2668039 RepID=A0A4Q9GSR0_9MICO|nr:SDR family NAD(P)-dependent oxidoreductase [Glaciihabitans arcticus]TBN58052.1 SDR family NAD(P)-dependent oxidoreductase [Glaciihabitans arcticus]
MTWTPAALPSQIGKTFVITGGNAGLGYFTAEQLARAGARVVLASRSLERADVAARSIRGQVAGASVDLLELDLASLDSVRTAGAELVGFERLDGLILNAGLTAGDSTRQVTADGHELMFGTNFLGHFALTALAWPALTRHPESRVVGLGSISTSLVPLDPDDLQSERHFDFFRAYAFSKHAVQGFILELDRRVRSAGLSVAATLAHPGYAIDGLTPFRPGVSEPPTVSRVGNALMLGSQGKNRGAASTVRAAIDPEIVGGEFVGPQFLTRGRPELARPVASSASPEFGQHLWKLAEDWSGVPFAVRS